MLSSAELRGIVRVGIELSAEKDRNRLLEKLLVTAMDVSACDAGTLYLYRDGCLVFRIMKTLSQGVSRGEGGQKIDLPPVALRDLPEAEVDRMADSDAWGMPVAEEEET